MRKTGIIVFFFCFITLSAIAQQGRTPVIVDINLANPIGTIRPLNGGNLGPIARGGTLNFTDYFKACKIPYVRLHDVVWFSRRAVDISTIFKNFKADPYKAENYDFRATDDYIASILNTGAKIVYRLGESIEPKHEYVNQYYVNPPSDFKKWAVICKHIIMHYNEGWANGFHYNIKYWEIWNEPDNRQNWTGTKEQYFKLYEITAKTIKESFPNLKVGGPAPTTIGTIKDRTFHIGDYVDDFLNYCKKNSIPLDFFSWHNYNTNPWRISQLAGYARSILDKHGFARTENILDEWNYLPPGGWAARNDQDAGKAKFYAEQHSARGAAFVADVLMLLQDQSIDMANIYTLTLGMFGLFNPISGAPEKTSYAFRAFSDMVNYTPVRLQTSYDRADSLVILTGANKEKTQVAILISNFTSSPKKVHFNLSHNFLKDPITYKVYIVDSTHNLSEGESREIEGGNVVKLAESIKGPSVVLLKLFSSALE